MMYFLTSGPELCSWLTTDLASEAQRHRFFLSLLLVGYCVHNSKELTNPHFVDLSGSRVRDPVLPLAGTVTLGHYLPSQSLRFLARALGLISPSSQGHPTDGNMGSNKRRYVNIQNNIPRNHR